MAKYAVTVDIGGTFTDLVCLEEETGEMLNAKVPSTPPDYIDGVINVLRKAGITAAQISLFQHGSTIATNAIIQRAECKAGLVTTKGMRDVLEAARAMKPDLFDLSWDPSAPLVPRRNRLTAAERVNYEGKVLLALNEDDVKHAAALFRKRGIEAVAVCFINSFMNPAHEIRAKGIIEKELPGVFVCNSYEILPEIREFERMSTTVANAYLGPLIKRYADELSSRMKGWGYSGDILVTHSGGGVMTLESARNIPARICQSGPAGGVMGAAYLAGLAGYDNIISLDMGGTSADLSLIYKKTPLMNSEWKVEFNIPITFPAIDLKTIGAGGGSIAWVDPGGMLKNGPMSAGASPGPACYDAGGDKPTNTDANLVLGRLNPETFLGGDMVIKEKPALKAIKAQVADFFGMTTHEAAEAILRIANDNMINAIRLISVQRGYDTRDFALLAFGGAGPLHAAELARELHIPRVVVPPYPGLVSAFGILTVDIRHDHLRPILQRGKEIDAEKIRRIYAELTKVSWSTLEKESIDEDKRQLLCSADIRYFGQSAYMTIPATGNDIGAQEIGSMISTFEERYQREFGYKMPPEVAEIDIVNARVTACGIRPKPKLRKYPSRDGSAQEALKGSRNVYFRECGGFTKTAIYDRARLTSGAKIKGPAIIEQPDSTTILPPDVTATVDPYLSVLIDIRAQV